MRARRHARERDLRARPDRPDDRPASLGLAGIAWITWRVAPRNPVLATAGALLVLCASGPVIHPWYLLWGGLLLAAVRLSAKHVRAVVFVTLFFVTYGVVDATVSNGTWALGVSAALWMAARLRANRRRVHEQSDEPVLAAVLAPPLTPAGQAVGQPRRAALSAIPSRMSCSDVTTSVTPARSTTRSTIAPPAPAPRRR